MKIIGVDKIRKVKHIKTFPVIIKRGKPIYTSDYYIMFGGTDIANTDTENRANLLKRALEQWQYTDDYIEWYNENILKEISKKKNKIKFNIKIEGK